MVAFEIVPPVPYPPVWLIVGFIAALIAIAAVTWLVFDLRKPATAGGPVSTLRQLQNARSTARAAIDEVERRFAAGELDLRGAHLELSWLVRTVIAEHSQIDPRALTAGEVASTRQAPDLADMLNRFQQPTFGEDPQAAMRTSADLARQVVDRW